MAKRTLNKDKTCEVSGCERPVLATMLCTMHYSRKLATGSVGEAAPRRAAGRRCSIEGCERRHQGHGLCDLHWKRWKTHGDPMCDNPVGVNLTRPPRKPPYNWRTMHLHLERTRGRAKEYECRFCGRDGHSWAYDYRDPDVRICEKRGSPYSLKIEHYIPLCASCHKTMDSRERATMGMTENGLVANLMKTISTLTARIDELENRLHEKAS